MSSLLTFIELRAVWALASVVLLGSTLFSVRYFFPRTWSEWLITGFTSITLFSAGHYIPMLFPPSPPYIVNPMNIVQTTDTVKGEWTVTVIVDTSVFCTSVMLTRMFSTEEKDYRFTAVGGTTRTLEDRTIGNGQGPGRRTYTRTYKIVPGLSGQYRVLISPSECENGWTTSYQLYSTPFDWR